VPKWIGTAVCVSIGATWAYTMFGGTLSIGHDPIVNQPQIVLTDGYLCINPGLGWTDSNPPYQVYLGHIPIPLLAILFVLVIPTVGLWLMERTHAMAGCCSKRGDDLTGNVSGR
jgi:hypothetical protein